MTRDQIETFLDRVSRITGAGLIVLFALIFLGIVVFGFYILIASSAHWAAYVGMTIIFLFMAGAFAPPLYELFMDALDEL